MKLEPYLVEKVWGGRKIANLKGLDDERLLGESWEVSTLKDQCSKLGGMNLSEYGNLDFLVKFIDTTDNLSVQVHPDEDFAKKFENSTGKTECWYIIDAKPGSGVYLGLKKGVTLKKLEEVTRAGGAVNELLNFYPAKKGDFFFVPAGTIHAIGDHVFLIEVQQASGITYRFWDWNRMDLDGKPRELHIDKALKVIDEKAEYFHRQSLDEFCFKNIFVKKIDGRTLEINKGSITVLSGDCNTYQAGQTFFTKKRLTLNSSSDFAGIWVRDEV